MQVGGEVVDVLLARLAQALQDAQAGGVGEPQKVVRKLVTLGLEKHNGCFIWSLTHKGSVMYARPSTPARLAGFPAERGGSLAAADQVQELRARAGVFAERAEHARRDHLAARLLDSAHLHAEVTRLDHDPHALRGQRPVERLRDLLRHPLLEL